MNKILYESYVIVFKGYLSRIKSYWLESTFALLLLLLSLYFLVPDILRTTPHGIYNFFTGILQNLFTFMIPLPLLWLIASTSQVTRLFQKILIWVIPNLITFLIIILFSHASDGAGAIIFLILYSAIAVFGCLMLSFFHFFRLYRNKKLDNDHTADNSSINLAANEERLKNKKKGIVGLVITTILIISAFSYPSATEYGLWGLVLFVDAVILFLTIFTAFRRS